MWQICLHHQESGMQGLRRFVCMQQCSFFYSVYDGAEDKESAKKQFQEAVKELEKSVCKEW